MAFGGWLQDFVRSKLIHNRRSAGQTVAERKTRFLIFSKMHGCTVDAAWKGLLAK